MRSFPTRPNPRSGNLNAIICMHQQTAPVQTAFGNLVTNLHHPREILPYGKPVPVQYCTGAKYCTDTI